MRPLSSSHTFLAWLEDEAPSRLPPPFLKELILHVQLWKDSLPLMAAQALFRPAPTFGLPSISSPLVDLNWTSKQDRAPRAPPVLDGLHFRMVGGSLSFNPPPLTYFHFPP